MPFVVVKDESACSASKPWAVKTKDSGKVHGCHASKSDAKKQQAALYANDAAATSAAAELERIHLSSFHKQQKVATSSVHVALPEPEVTYDHGDVVLAKLAHIPLLEMGMQFPASTGRVTFTERHLSAAVSAGGDPTLPRPRVKLGHADPRYNDFACPHCNGVIAADPNNSYVWDGTPSFGFVENMSIEDGAYVYGDLVDVPLWLAKIAPVAWPSRSIEGWHDFTGINDKTYEFVFTACALLGVVFPGCLSLEDLPQMYGSEMPDFVQVLEAA